MVGTRQSSSLYNFDAWAGGRLAAHRHGQQEVPGVGSEDDLGRLPLGEHAPADLAELISACADSGLLLVPRIPAGHVPPPGDMPPVFVDRQVAGTLHQDLAAAGRGDEVTGAHQRAAGTSVVTDWRSGGTRISEWSGKGGASSVSSRVGA